jgi:hypothetical protein
LNGLLGEATASRVYYIGARSISDLPRHKREQHNEGWNEETAVHCRSRRGTIMFSLAVLLTALPTAAQDQGFGIDPPRRPARMRISPQTSCASGKRTAPTFSACWL